MMNRSLLAALVGMTLLMSACESPAPAPEPPPPSAVPEPVKDAPPATVATASTAPAEPAPTSPPAAVVEPSPPAPAALPQMLSPETIEKTFRLHERFFAKAYKDYLPKHPGMNGTVSVDFTVNADGTAQGARLADSSIKDAVFDATVVKLVGQMNFPPAQAATPVSRYPVKFQRFSKK